MLLCIYTQMTHIATLPVFSPAAARICNCAAILHLKSVVNDKKFDAWNFTSEGRPIELASSYKYLGFVLDNELSFYLHTEQMIQD